MPTRSQQFGLIILLVALVTCTSSGRSLPRAGRGRSSSPSSARPHRARARSVWRWPKRYGGEIINCDSTAVYRGFDIGTDKLPIEERRGIPHHLIDIADPTEVYTAAQFAEDAERSSATSTRGAAADPGRRHGLLLPCADARPVPGPARTRPCARGSTGGRPAGPERLHRHAAARRSGIGRANHAADRKRLVRALEVYFATGQPLTAHFAETRVAHRGLRGDRARPAAAGRADGGTRGATSRRAVRARDRG